MKIALHLLAVALFCLVPVAIASAADDAPERPKDEPAKPAEAAAKNFNAMDKDGDGALTFDEFKGTRKKPEAIEQAEQIFKLSDADGDKRLSLKEFINRPAEARFKQMDRDNDGKLTWDEFKGTRKPEELDQAEQNFKRMDTDGDKCLCLDEFKAGQKPPMKPAKKAAGKKFQPKQVESAVKEGQLRSAPSGLVGWARDQVVPARPWTSEGDDRGPDLHGSLRWLAGGILVSEPGLGP